MNAVNDMLNLANKNSKGATKMYLVQIILTSNTNLNILVSSVIDTLHKAGFEQVETIKGISHVPSNDYGGKIDMTIVQVELKLPEPTLSVIDYLHKITEDKLKRFKIRLINLK